MSTLGTGTLGSGTLGNPGTDEGTWGKPLITHAPPKHTKRRTRRRYTHAGTSRHGVSAHSRPLRSLVPSSAPTAEASSGTALDVAASHTPHTAALHLRAVNVSSRHGPVIHHPDDEAVLLAAVGLLSPQE